MKSRPHDLAMAHRARWAAFVLIAGVAATCGIVVLAGGWTAGALVGTVFTGSALISFIGLLVAAIRARDHASGS